MDAERWMLQCYSNSSCTYPYLVDISPTPSCQDLQLLESSWQSSPGITICTIPPYPPWRPLLPIVGTPKPTTASRQTSREPSFSRLMSHATLPLSSTILASVKQLVSGHGPSSGPCSSASPSSWLASMPKS